MLNGNGNGEPLLLRKQRNSKQQGDVGLAIAIESRFYSVQVRTTYYKNPQGWYQANLKVSGGNRSGTGKIKLFDRNRVNYLFIVTDNEELYFIPCGMITSKGSITLCEKYEEYRVR